MEYDSPAHLLEDKTSAFFNLAMEFLTRSSSLKEENYAYV